VESQRGDGGGVGMAVDAENPAFFAEPVAVEVQIVILMVPVRTWMRVATIAAATAAGLVTVHHQLRLRSSRLTSIVAALLPGRRRLVT
jgi:hypothetical protein